MYQGVDLLFTALSRLRNHDFFPWSRQILDVPGRTVSMNFLGTKVLLTDDPENAKAVLATKVGIRTEVQEALNSRCSLVFRLW